MNSPATVEQGLVLERILPAVPDTVWRAWTEPEQLRKWFMPPGGRCPSAVVDLRVGGRYRLQMKPPLAPTSWVGGSYLAVDPHVLLRYTMEWEGLPWQPDDSVVTVEFASEGLGTRIRIHHAPLRRRRDRGFHALGWRRSLRKLAGILEP